MEPTINCGWLHGYYCTQLVIKHTPAMSIFNSILLYVISISPVLALQLWDFLDACPSLPFF